MKLLILLLLLYLTSCSLSLKTSRLGVPNPPSKRSVNFVENDLLNPSKETILIDHYRSLNTAPLIIDDKLLYTTKNGRFFSYDLKKKKIIEKESYCYGTNLSPLVYGNNLFLFSSVGKESVQMFHKGEKIWTKDIPYGIESMPAIDDSGIYIAAANGKMYKLNTATGKLIWEIQLKKPVHSDLSAFFELIILSDDSGKLMALDKQTGNEIWKIKFDKGASYTKPILVGTKLIYSTISGYIAEINPLVGKIIWERTISAPIYSTPSSDGKHLYFGANDRNVYKLDFDGKIIATYQTESNVNSQILIGNKMLYFGTGQGVFRALNKNNFTLAWEKKFKGRFIASPLFWEDNLILFSDNDDVFMYAEHDENLASTN